jgi:3-oxoacyl-[acyl-carrier-protein] synthase I
VNCYLSDLAIVNALGCGQQAVLDGLLAGDQAGMRPCGPFLTGRKGFAGEVGAQLHEVPERLQAFDCRNNRLLVTAAAQLAAAIEELRSRVGEARIAVLIGTSTSGIAEGEDAVAALASSGAMPARFNYCQQEIGTAAEFLARYLSLSGPRYTISTACSSSAKAIIAARRLIAAGHCDAAIAGGCDSLCKLTSNGFDALESMSDGICNPFSANRNGINVGEGAALFLLGHDEAAVRLAGAGESSDAWHMSAPEPSGRGAELAIRAAIADAGVQPRHIAYVNLHGTATVLNDEMESHVIARVFGASTPCSSTKSQIGHTLGAAGAQELALCWLLLQDANRGRRLPRHLWDGEADPALAAIGLTGEGAVWEQGLFMSNSFAFGGSNASIIIGRA